VKKYIILMSLVLLGILFISGCGKIAEVIKGLSDDTAQGYASEGAAMSQDIYASIADWAAGGEVSSFNLSEVNVATVVTQETGGWYHITGTTDSAVIDLHVKLSLNSLLPSSSKTKTVSLYGTYVYTGSDATITQTYGDSSNNFTAETTWSNSNSSLEQISLDGIIKTYIVGIAGHTTSMQLTLSSLYLSLTAAENYPSGTIVINTSYDGTVQPAITLIFNGTSTVIFQYDTTTRTFSIRGISLTV